MASVSDDDGIPVEETGKRRTRSGRKSATIPTPVTPSRSSRRTRRTADPEPEPEPEHTAQLSDASDQPAPAQHSQSMDSSSRSSFAATTSNTTAETNEGCGNSTAATAEGEEESTTTTPTTVSATNPTTDSIDNLLANLAEDNANSLPSVGNNDDDDDRQADHQQQLAPTVTATLAAAKARDAAMEEVGEEEEAAAAHQQQQQQSDDEEDTTNAGSTSCSEDAASSRSSADRACALPPPNGGSDSQSQATMATIADAEMVSEDELPPPPPPPRAQQRPQQQQQSMSALPVRVDDAEEVSDDELPGPRLAELPADTEVVSEDELPVAVVAGAAAASKAGKRKGGDGDYEELKDGPESSAEKRTKRAGSAGADDSLTSLTAAKEADKKPEKKVLPDLEKYWKAVRTDPADFTGWTYLLQYVDQENDIEAAREAYDAFLGHYPYCYGYWRKYADYEKRKGNPDKCVQVFQRGLLAIPLSVDLWIHYLTYVKQQHGNNEAPIRAQFEKAIAECGLEFRSDKLWEAYIKWETEGKRVARVIGVYDRLLATPTQGYNGHFDSFQEIINNNPASALVSVDEFKRHRSEVREANAPPIDSTAPAAAADQSAEIDADAADADNADTESPAVPEADDHVRSDDEATAIKDKILAARRKVHKLTVQAVTARWTFEEGIKRPYFHVKPLERCQLKNWKDYLDFEIAAGDRRRVLVLFERCLIACALYDEFWLKLVRYLEAQQKLAGAEDASAMTAKIREVFRRACLVHHPDKPALHMLWASFEECHEGAEQAAEILGDLERSTPNVLQIAYRRINLERRRGDLGRAQQLYESYLAEAVRVREETGKGAANCASLAIKYARFLHKHRGDLDGAAGVLREALQRDSRDTRIVLQLIDLLLQRERVVEAEVVAVIDGFVAGDGADVDGALELEQQVLFAQRKVEFLEDFGECAVRMQAAQRALQAVTGRANEAKKKSELSATKKAITKDTAHLAASAQASAYGGGSYGSSGAATSAALGAAGSASSGGYYAGQQQQHYGQSQSQQQAYAGDGGYAYSQQQWQQQYGGGGSSGGGNGAAGGGNGAAGAYGGYSQWGGYY